MHLGSESQLLCQACFHQLPELARIQRACVPAIEGIENQAIAARTDAMTDIRLFAELTVASIVCQLLDSLLARLAERAQLLATGFAQGCRVDTRLSSEASAVSPAARNQQCKSDDAALVVLFRPSLHTMQQPSASKRCQQPALQQAAAQRDATPKTVRDQAAATQKSVRITAVRRSAQSARIAAIPACDARSSSD